jgi:hypothetical protein
MRAAAHAKRLERIFPRLRESDATQEIIELVRAGR